MKRGNGILIKNVRSGNGRKCAQTNLYIVVGANALARDRLLTVCLVVVV